MDRVRFGRTGLEVSVGCLGTGGGSALGQKYGSSAEESIRVVQAALDLGINVIDTSSGYGTEEIVGRAIRGHRGEVVISTKNVITKNPVSRGEDFVTGAEFAGLFEGNLRRLDTDYVDVMHIHGLMPNQYEYFVAEILPVMRDLRAEGKIRFIGVSELYNYDKSHEMLGRALEDDCLDVMMVGVNIIHHVALRHVLPLAKERDVGVMAMFAVRGKLAFAESAKSVVDEAIAAGEVDPADVDRDDPLGFLVAPGVAESLSEACYRFDRYAPGVDSVMTGTGRIEHLTENVRSINGPPLPLEIVDRLGRVFGRVETVIGQ